MSSRPLISNIFYGPITLEAFQGTVYSLSTEPLTLDVIRRVKMILLQQDRERIAHDPVRKAPKDWKPTVPHPLMQIDEELGR